MRDIPPLPDDGTAMWNSIRWIESLLHKLVGGGRQRAVARADHWPALATLRARFALSTFECDLLLLCTALELNPALAELCAKAESPNHRPFPTLSLAIRLFAKAHTRAEHKPSWSVLSPNGPLLRWRLLELQPAGSYATAAVMLKLDPRILHFLMGLNGNAEGLALSPSVQRLLVPVAPDDCELSASQKNIAQKIARLLRHPGAEVAVAQLLGPSGAAKNLIVRGALQRVREEAANPVFLYKLAVDTWPIATDVQSFALLWKREQRLYPDLFLFLDAEKVDPDERERKAVMDELLKRIDQGRLLVAAPRPFVMDDCIVHLFDVDKPTPDEQKKRWIKQLRIAPDDAGQLVSRFNLNFPGIDALAGELHGSANDELVVDRLSDVCHNFTRPRLDALAERVEARATWPDLILPQAERKVLHQIADQVRSLSKVYDDWGVRGTLSRGLGIGVLFAGESGTGKTFAAEVLAQSLHLDLYRIDLSAVVDKYIGETEKNLRRLFDAAEDGGCILLFDEADALFGKRSEVKDSHDRFANIQVNYLLQRIESFRGLAILTTNRKSALDGAFLRRLRFVVSFPFPSEQERRSMWERMLPSEPQSDRHVPVALTSGDYDLLARLSLTGGNIRTVMLNAVFLAAAQHKKVTLDLIKDAARIEYRKLGREFPAELRELPRPRLAEGAAG